MEIKAVQSSLRAGTNLVEIDAAGNKMVAHVQQWNMDKQEQNKYEKINLSSFSTTRSPIFFQIII